MPRILHFADAHIDIAGHGRHDPLTGLPLRVLDFLKAVDTIVDTALQERVDLVIFAGDAYKDRTPVPTFQREWGRRIMRLSDAGIPTLILVGNHDLSPALGRAHALQEFETLQVPHIRVISQPCFLRPEDLEGLPLQVIGLPWINRSGMMARSEMSAAEPEQVFEKMEEKVAALIRTWLDEKIDPGLPVILTAHASVEGAVYGGERSVMLGSDMVLSGSLVRDPRLDYVALGHIHKAQNLNPDQHPPVIYPGSVERVDFGEAEDEKFFVIAEVERGRCQVDWRKLSGRRFIDRRVSIESPEGVMEKVMAAMPSQDELNDAIFRLVIDYPRQWESMLDELELRHYAEAAFEFHLIRRPQLEVRLRLPEETSISSLQPLDLLSLYWDTVHTGNEDKEGLQKLAQEVIASAGMGGDA